jgi:gamma-glutamyltranspeptidase/glutathione hydrolase
LSPVEGHGDTVVSPHFLATRAGIEIFEAGGSAVDAAIAVDAMLGVVAPETCGIGGDLFALIWEPGMPAPAALNSSGWAGSGADAADLRALGHQRMPAFHPLTVTVPGCVAGWSELSARFGHLSLSDCIAPAIRAAEAGFPVSTELAAALEAREAILAPQPSGVELYPQGRPPRRGETVRRLLLARTLRAIATEGRDAYYRGSPAEAISEAVGGVITTADLAGYAPDWVDPARLDVFGLTGWTIPPNSQGYLTLATAGIFERVSESESGSAQWFHDLVEAYRSVAWERDTVLSDPRTAVDWRELLNPARLDRIAASIDRSRPNRWPVPTPAPGGTAYMCTATADGQAVSFIQSNFMGIGSGIGAGDAGFFLHNRGAGFNLVEGHRNELAAGRRPLHTLSPSMWTRGDEFHAVLGTRGGHQQPQILAQMAANLFDAGLDPATAQNRPRWTLDEFGPGASPVLKVEGTLPSETVDDLRRRGHAVQVCADLEGGWGPVSTIVAGPAGYRAASDPRVDTAEAMMTARR